LCGLFVYAAEVILSDPKARIMGSEYLFYTTGSRRREIRLRSVKLVVLHDPDRLPGILATCIASCPSDIEGEQPL
jgi:hypothetical protein